MKELLKGKIQGNASGYAFLIVENGEDYFIPHSFLKGAYHGDTVICERCFEDGKRTVAKVLKIVERGLTTLVGTFYLGRHGAYVLPDDDKFCNNVNICVEKSKRAKKGDKVVCKITDYPKRENPIGIVIEVLGKQYEKEAELKSLYRVYNISENFPKAVIDCAEKIIPPKKEDLANRIDLTNEVIFTIDGDDAKDYDDAVSVEKLKNGNYKLGVHIADVSNYVKRNDVIDNEALKRGTSVYFPEKVFPMLPEKLCNDVCSLTEGKIRLTLSCIMEIDAKGKVLNTEIVPSYIKSKARMTYSNVQKILDGDKLLIKKYKDIVSQIKLMNSLCDVLSEKRNKKGNIDLEVKESEIRVIDNKISVEASVQNKAQKIIEEFMICANVSVAEYMFYLEKPFIYRVHGKPTEERLEKFYSFLDGIGIKYSKKKDEVFSKDFQTILEKSRNTPVFTLINRVMLRSMQKAKYSTEAEGHFGLSEDHYCHFTSPIRRYPDLCIHRVIKDFLQGKSIFEESTNYLDYVAKQSSDKERNSIDAERAVDDYYKMLYISDYVGEEFDGVISGVTKFGIFVELPNGIEGLIKIENLKGSRYKLNEESYTLSNGERNYKLGQSIKIMVAGVDLANRKAEFIIA